MAQRDEEFFVGYASEAPRALGAFLRRLVAGLVIGSVSLGVLLSVFHERAPAAFFEFGRETILSGTLQSAPYPTLLVSRPGRRDGGGTSDRVSRYLLVTEGKHGAFAETRGGDGATVTVRGSLIYRGNQTMVELVEKMGITRPGSGSLTSPIPRDLGNFTLSGEIVDAKCFLGVMNPGNLKPHRSCAARCISGGVPPLFIVRDPSGASASLLLVSSAGAPVNREALQHVAQPVRITGRVERQGDRLILRADPRTYERLP